MNFPDMIAPSFRSPARQDVAESAHRLALALERNAVGNTDALLADLAGLVQRMYQVLP